MQDVSEIWIYQRICLQYHAAEKNQATSQKSLGITTLLMAKLFEQEFENSNFHLLLRMNNPCELLSETPLLLQSVEFT